MKTEQMTTTVRASRWGAVFLALALFLLGIGCAHRPISSPAMAPPPEKARIEALIDYYVKAKANQETSVSLEMFKVAVILSVDIWEAYALSVVDREELARLSEIDKLELQGRINSEAARADRNARWIWYTVAGGLVLSIVGFVVGAAAF